MGAGDLLGWLSASWTFNTGLVGLVLGSRANVAGPSEWASATVRSLLLVLVCWRVSYMLVMEDGPWLVFTRFRNLRGTETSPNHELLATRPGTAWACINCMSVWVALWLPFVPAWLVAFLGLSALVVWFRRHTIG